MWQINNQQFEISTYKLVIGGTNRCATAGVQLWLASSYWANKRKNIIP
jgi:hypothetical protein